jgi:two-component system, chemotaxis family, protein-glutamate methylesterase/glutaminase
MTQAHPQGVGSDAVRVLVCDDFVVMRAALARAFESDPAIRVVARVADGKQALAEVQRQTIDVVVLDIEMPVMDGLTALPRLMRAAPRLRVLMASTLTTRGAEVTLQALRLGAADYVAKPSAIPLIDQLTRHA